MAKKQQQKFEILAEIKTFANVYVPAETFEQALEISKTLKADDFLYNNKFGGGIESQELDVRIIGKV